MALDLIVFCFNKMFINNERHRVDDSFQLSGSAGAVRAEEGQRQQGHHRLQHHVHRGAVPTLPQVS